MYENKNQSRKRRTNLVKNIARIANAVQVTDCRVTVSNSQLVTKSRNIAKGTTDPRVEFISQFLTQISIKFHFQNLD